jgi:outer membrane protein OmpA-like peptidoglycan-associated protein
VGLQAELSGIGLASGTAPSTRGVAPHSAGFDFGAMAGARIHPLGQQRVDGLWADANGGVSVTGTLVRPSFDAHVGYDFRVRGTRIDLGPFVGYTQVFASPHTPNPGDAHILWLGAHIALGGRPVGRGDRDRDAVFDDEDACPDVPGIRTNDPKTNGCPRTDRDNDTVFDDEDACPDVPGNRTNDPKTNGCPRTDRDNDTVLDDEDACPDVPGIRTNDPKTNGCPPAGDQVHLEGDKILLDDTIHFDTDSPRVHHASWAIIKKVADFMSANPDVLEVDIEGHADETGSTEHNLVLSRQRAQAVKQIIVQYGVEEKRITTHSYGESRPKVPGHAEEQLRQNRRVEFTVTRSRARPQELTPKESAIQPGGVP